MKIKTKKNNRKKIAITTTVVVILVFLSYAWLSHHYLLWPFNKASTSSNKEKNNSDTTNSQQKSSTSKPVDGVDVNKNSSEVPVSDTTSIEITDLSQNDNIISYSANITNPASAGVCRATFTKTDSRTLVYDTTVSSSKCSLSSIPASDFDAIGTWTLTLRYFANNAQAVATKTIEVK